MKDESVKQGIYSHARPRYIGGETFGNPSMTVPGQDLTVEQLYRRLATGRDVPEMQPVYTDAVPPGIEFLDATARKDLARRLRVQMLEMQADLQRIAEADKAAKEAEKGRKPDTEQSPADTKPVEEVKV